MSLHFIPRPAPEKTVAITHSELFDGEEFGVTHVATSHAARAIEDGQGNQVSGLILANGSFTGRTVLAPLVSGIVHLAEDDGRSIEVTTYDDPFTGTSAYGQSYRTERYLQVVRHVRKARQQDTEHPLYMAGQSRGWITAVEAATDLEQHERIGGLAGISPIGHLPMEVVICPKDIAHITALTVRELLDWRTFVLFDRMARIVKCEIVRNAVTHTIGNITTAHSLPEAVHHAAMPLFKEVHEILTTDVTDKVVELSKKLGTALTVIASSYDHYAPGELILDRLCPAVGFAGRLVLLDTSHNGPLLDKRLTPLMYDLLLPAKEAKNAT